jgi:hypothetical protein
MFRSLTILLLAVGAMGTAPAQARAEGSPLFAAFQRFCVDKAGDAEASKAAALAAGFVQFDPPAGQLDGAATFISQQGGDRRLVSVKTSVEPGPPPVAQVDQTICGYGQSTADPGFGQEAIRWAGVPEDVNSSQGNTHAFAFTINPDGSRRSLAGASDDEIAKVLRQTGVWLLLVDEVDSPTLVLVFLRARPAS